MFAFGHLSGHCGTPCALLSLTTFLLGAFGDVTSLHAEQWAYYPITNSVYKIVVDSSHVFAVTPSGLVSVDKRTGERTFSYSANHGFPPGTVTNIFRDVDGGMWCATPDGVYERDGVNWRSHGEAILAVAGGSDLRIRTMKMDRVGGIWVVAQNTILLRYVNRSWELAPNPLLSTRPDTCGTVYDICFDAEHNLWLTTWDCVVQRFDSSGTETTPGLPDSVSVTGSAALRPGNAGGMCLFFGRSVGYYDGGTWKIFGDFTDCHACGTIDMEGNAWHLSHKGIVRLDSSGKSTHGPRSFLWPARQQSTVAVDCDSTVWFATQEGLWSYKKGLWDSVATNLTPFGDFVGHVLMDSVGRLWIHSDGIRQVTMDTWPDIAVGENTIDTGWAGDMVCAEDGLIWASLRQGLCTFDGARWALVDTTGLSPARYTITAIEKGPDGRIWIGVYTGGSPDTVGSIWYFDGAGWVDTYAGSTDSYRAIEPFRIFADSRGAVWVADAWNGTSRYDGHQWRTAANDSMPRHYVYHFHEDPLGIVWMTTRDGIAGWCDSGWVAFRDVHPQVPVDVKSILHRESSGAMWYTTERGLKRCRDGNCIDYDHTNSPLPAKVFAAEAVEDRTGRIWFNLHGLGAAVFSPVVSRARPGASVERDDRHVRILGVLRNGGRLAVDCAVSGGESVTLRVVDLRGRTVYADRISTHGKTTKRFVLRPHRPGSEQESGGVYVLTAEMGGRRDTRVLPRLPRN